MRRILLVAPLCLASMVVGVMLGRPVVGQPTLPYMRPLNQVGRYQMAAVANGANTNIVVLDTTTGQCWKFQDAADGGWSSHGSPAEAKK